MDERFNNTQHTDGVDLQKALTAIFGKLWLIILVSVLSAVLSFAGTYFLITPQYESSALFYVNNSSLSLGDATLSIDSGDISASKSLVNSYIVILNSRESINEVIEYSGVNRTYSQVKEMITATSVNNTEIFEVVVTSPDPKEAELIASAIATVLPERIANIIEGSSAKVVDCAVLASKPSSPSYPVNVIVGFLIGFVAMVGVILVQAIFDVQIRSDEDIEELCHLPILASVPDMLANSKGGYEYRYDTKSNTAKKNLQAKRPAVIGSDISFAASEAYKLLRTKLQFSFPDSTSSKVIGITSSLSGEGKSLTAVNLAYSLSQLNKTVLLIDCDMRRPTVAEKLNLNKKPGLSSCLTGQTDLSELVQTVTLSSTSNPFHVISAGENPPNPAELLSSAKMHHVLEGLRQSYDYIILDLPPVIEVSDALAVAKETDGMLLVVRQNVCDRKVLSDTLRQFDFVDAKILGVIFNSIQGNGGKGYYKRYHRYYRKYYGKYYSRSYYNNDRHS